MDPPRRQPQILRNPSLGFPKVSASRFPALPQPAPLHLHEASGSLVPAADPAGQLAGWALASAAELMGLLHSETLAHLPNWPPGA